MDYMKTVGIITATVALLGLGYKAGLRGGYITDSVMAKAIAQEVVAAEEAQRLEFQLEYKQAQLRPLQRIPKAERSEEDQDTIDDLKAQISAIKCRLGKTESCNKAAMEDEP